MKWKVMLLVFSAFTSTVLVAAQSGSTAKKTATAGSSPASVIVMGCVDDGGESGAYMLTNAVMRNTPKARPTPAPNSGTIGIRYTLVGTELQAHVGHKVEVTGLMDAPLKKRGTKSSDREKAAATVQAMNGTLTVQSLRMLSPTCP